MKKKGLTVEKVLRSLPEDDEVMVAYYAYGIHYADSWTDNLHTVKELLEKTRYDCLNATVIRLKANWVRKNEDAEKRWLPVIYAELAM